MTTLVLPFHQDERVGERSIALPAESAPTTVEPRLTGPDQWQRLVALYDGLGDAVSGSIGSGELTTVFTGDCLATLGTLAGAQRAGLTPSIVWFDAHGDVHTVASSTSGYLGGMALRMALGGDAGRLARPLGLQPVPESRAVLVDARDLDPAEAEYLAASAITRTQVAEVSAAHLPEGPVVLHVDLDVIDSSEVPGLRFPAAGGPTADAVLRALQRLLDTRRVAVLEIACPWHEPTDDEQARRLAELLSRLTGLAYDT